MRRVVLTLIAVLAVSSVSAQENDTEFPVPQWKKGTWWTVRSFQKDRSHEIAGIPKPPIAAIPGYPPLKGSQKTNYIEVGTFRFTCKGTVSIEENRSVRVIPELTEAEAATPESQHAFEQVEAKVTEVPCFQIDVTREKETAVLATLFFDADTFRLRRVDETGKKSVRLDDPVAIDFAAEASLSIPLTWADISRLNSKDIKNTLVLSDGSKVQTRLYKRKRAQILDMKKRVGDSGVVTRARQLWRPGTPWWSKSLQSDCKAELVAHGEKE